MKAGHSRLIPQSHLVHVHIGSLAHPLAEDGGALRGGFKSVNLSSGRVVQQLIHRVTMMSSDIQNGHGLELAVNLSHRVVPIRHVEQLFNAMHQGTLDSASHAAVCQETMELAKHRGGL